MQNELSLFLVCIEYDALPQAFPCLWAQLLSYQKNEERIPKLLQYTIPFAQIPSAKKDSRCSGLALTCLGLEEPGGWHMASRATPAVPPAGPVPPNLHPHPLPPLPRVRQRAAGASGCTQWGPCRWEGECRWHCKDTGGCVMDLLGLLWGYH